MRVVSCFFLCFFCCAADLFADDWFPFQPRADARADSLISLRSLNEKVAGEHEFVTAKNGQFLLSKTGEPIRFWAVNGPPENLKGDELRRAARLLADYGVNLVRVHGALFDRNGEVDPAKIQHAHDVVAAMKAEGIYTHFSIYFPLWFTPSKNLPWLKGYDGQKHPFAALQFNPEFQEKYRGWLRALLTTKNQHTGTTLLDEPAVFGIELQNEDSYFFWTFDARNIPDPQLEILEAHFGTWLSKKYGSLQTAVAKWKGATVPRDAIKAGRIGFRPLWNIAHEKTARDQDTAQFLLESQTDFYRAGYDYLRTLGFKGLINCSNWTTADAQVLGPLEKESYLVGDFVDRHGYFECHHQGDNAAWSIRPGHTFSNRSALRFDADEPGKPRQFVHSVIDPHYNDKPSMISETTFTRPNRYRSEAPLYYAAYGALQDSNCIVHFAFDGAKWDVKPNFWMQQWTLATPAMLGQFPAAALIYRKGLVKTGVVVADVTLNRQDLLHLQGTPLPQDAALDELRLKDLPQGTEVKPGQRLDPLLHYVGRTHVEFSDKPSHVRVQDFNSHIDHQKQLVTSTTGELSLDYQHGLLAINTPEAQGVSGNLKVAGSAKLEALTVECDLDLAHIIAVSLDGQPLDRSKRILLQTMTEERASEFATQPVDAHTQRITNIGRDPWQVKKLSGTVKFLRADASQLKVTALDVNGKRANEVGHADSIRLQPETVYYLLEE